MVKNKDTEIEPKKRKITVEAANVEGIAAALGMELVEDDATQGSTGYPEELDAVLATLVDVYSGVKIATENDSRGRSRKMVRQYADREDLDSAVVGNYLRVLEGHDLVVQDGNRWRVPDEAE